MPACGEERERERERERRAVSRGKEGEEVGGYGGLTRMGVAMEDV